MSLRPRLVMKFGGTSVASLERIRAAALRVQHEQQQGFDVVVTVSAMAGVTNSLVQYVTDMAPLYDPHEYDAVVATGEQVTSGLMALALQNLGLQARSYAGHQVAVVTDNTHGAARITNVQTAALEQGFARGEIAVVAGFQGVSEQGRTTTLGRGGSDTSAAALAAALGARCDIYTDVDGVYSADPRVVPLARKISQITYEEMLEYASSGAKVLHPRSVELSMNYNVPLRVLSSLQNLPGTLICAEENDMEKPPVTGVAAATDESKITLRRVADKPGIAASIFVPLAAAGLNVDMIVQSMAADGTTDVTFTVGRADSARTLQVVREQKHTIGYSELHVSENLAKVSVIGAGMRSHAGTAATMFEVLAQQGINIYVISTSEIKISVLIDNAHAKAAMQALHTAFNLDDVAKAEAAA